MLVGSDVYVIGGATGLNADTAVASASGYRYDTAQNEWSSLPPMPEARYACSACVLYVMGGKSASYTVLSSVIRFDPVSSSWSTVAPMSTARAFLGSYPLGGCLYAAGGYGGHNYLNTVEKYDPDTDSWSAVGAMGHIRSGFCAQSMKLEVNLFDALIARAEAMSRGANSGRGVR